MNQVKNKNRYIHLTLFLFVMIQTPVVQSQRIFTSTGILVSKVDNNIFPSHYQGIVFRPSIGLGFETKQWHRLSLSNFTSGGKKGSSYFSNFKSYDYQYFDNYSVGAIGNFFIVKRKNRGMTSMNQSHLL